jgi:hypothetical protein
MIDFTKAQLTAAITEAGVAIPRKANLTVLTALHAALPREQQLCPHCGIHLSNGLLHVDDEVANGNGETYRTTRDQAFLEGEYNCMGCGGHFGDPATFDAPKEDAHTGTGLKIEKDRPEQNGIKRPSIGGKCRAIWDALDEYRAETGELPTSKTVKELAADSGWNPNNASIEYYQWRKFNGIAKGQ